MRIFMDCLIFYTPKLLKEILDKHKLGLSVYMMQGFEKRDKESKNNFEDYVIEKEIYYYKICKFYRIHFYSHNAYQYSK